MTAVQEMSQKRKIVVPSYSHCCSGKLLLHIPSVCL